MNSKQLLFLNLDLFVRLLATIFLGVMFRSVLAEFGYALSVTIALTALSLGAVVSVHGYIRNRRETRRTGVLHLGF